MAVSRTILVGALASVILVACIGYGYIQAEPLTFSKEKLLPATVLARKLLGERLGAKVIEAVRHERNGLPDYTEFYTQPEFGAPQLNGICRTDVITVEYNWPESSRASAALKIIHVEAIPRYKAFPVPPGEPGTSANGKAQAAACAAMKTARDAFRAPSSGDAQWLAAIETEYVGGAGPFAFTCSDFADGSCVQAKRALTQLKLKPSTEVKGVDCPKGKSGDQLDECYRLTFPYPGHDEYSDNQDRRDAEDYDPEWIVTIFAGMHDGYAPVRIRSLNMEHVPRPIVMY